MKKKIYVLMHEKANVFGEGGGFASYVMVTDEKPKTLVVDNDCKKNSFLWVKTLKKSNENRIIKNRYGNTSLRVFTTDENKIPELKEQLKKLVKKELIRKYESAKGDLERFNEYVKNF
jgi:hypothetical protein